MSARHEDDHLAVVTYIGKAREVLMFESCQIRSHLLVGRLPWQRRESRPAFWFTPEITFLDHWTRFHLPDFVGILGDGAIGRELPRTRNIQDGLPRPSVLVVI